MKILIGALLSSAIIAFSTTVPWPSGANATLTSTSREAHASTSYASATGVNVELTAGGDYGYSLTNASKQTHRLGKNDAES